MPLSLLVVRGPIQEQVIPVPGLEFCIGRDPGCDLCVTNMMISRRHAVLVTRHGKVLVRDLGSRNGTYVNGTAVTDECELRHADRLQLGPVEYRVQLEPPVSPENHGDGTLCEDFLDSPINQEKKTDRHRPLPPNATLAKDRPNGWQVLVAMAFGHGVAATSSGLRQGTLTQ